MNETCMIILRSITAFFSLHIFVRILGKKSIGQLTFFDYVLGITVGSMAATLSVDLNTRAWTHWLAMLAWTLIILIMEFFTIHSKHFSKYALGEPSIVMMNGQIMEQTLKNLRYPLSEMLAQLRDKNIFDLSQVAFAILETNGKLSVLLKSEYQPISCKDCLIKSPEKQPVQLPKKLIFCGMILEENLLALHLSKNWLISYLKNHNIQKIEDVFLFAVNSDGSFYCDLYSDHIEKGM